MFPSELIGFDITHNGQKWYVICREFGPYRDYEAAEAAAEDANKRLRKSVEQVSSV